MTQLLADLDGWLAAQWDPALTVGRWWALARRRRVGGAVAAAGARRARCVAGRSRRRSPRGSPAHGALRAAGWARASRSSRRRSPRTSPTATSTTCCARPSPGELAWCLLFSEPGAGTDLANLTTTATRDGDGWRLDGRKTWATGAHVADRALVLARSDPDGARHRGLTCFVLDVRQPDAVEVRPMREMTGRALSNDVWLRGAWATTVLGDVGDGWRVVNTALSAERSSVGSHRSSPGRAGLARR